MCARRQAADAINKTCMTVLAHAASRKLKGSNFEIISSKDIQARCYFVLYYLKQGTSHDQILLICCHIFRWPEVAMAKLFQGSSGDLAVSQIDCLVDGNDEDAAISDGIDDDEIYDDESRVVAANTKSNDDKEEFISLGPDTFSSKEHRLDGSSYDSKTSSELVSEVINQKSSKSSEASEESSATSKKMSVSGNKRKKSNTSSFKLYSFKKMLNGGSS